MTQPAPSNMQATTEEQVELQLRRRRARRMALALGFVALCVYLGFILATGLRS